MLSIESFGYGAGVRAVFLVQPKLDAFADVLRVCAWPSRPFPMSIRLPLPPRAPPAVRAALHVAPVQAQPHQKPSRAAAQRQRRRWGAQRVEFIHAAACWAVARMLLQWR